MTDRLHLRLARSAVGRRLASKVRNQCNMVLQRAISPYLDDAGRNGEHWILELVGSDVETAVDVGANQGEWTLAVVRAAPRIERVVAYEPAEAACRRLRALAEELGDRLTVRPIALSDAAGAARLVEEAGDGQQSSLFPGPGLPEGTSIEVRTASLDEECKALGLDRVDFLKIDAEGAEFLVLKGASGLLERAAVGFIQFEYNAPWRFAGSTLTAAVGFLGSYGYSVFLLQQGALLTVDLGKIGEYFAYSNFLAVPERELARVAHLVRELRL